MTKELIIMPSWIGDLALALSVVERKITMQNADVTLLVPENLVELCGVLASHKIIPYSRKTALKAKETLERIKNEHFEVVYVLPHSFSSAWLSLRSGIKRRCGISRELREFLFTRALPRSVRTHERHITYEYALVTETDYVPPEYWQGIDFEEAKEHTGKIVFCPGSMYGPAKRWTGFRELIEYLPGKQIVVLGDTRDSEVADALEATSPDRILNLAGKTTIVEACRIIAAAKAVVANDSGLMHIAGYIGTPVIGIFGSTTPVWTKPLGAKVEIAYVKQVCSPCFERTCRYKHYNCLKHVSAENVAALVHKILHDKPGTY